MTTRPDLDAIASALQTENYSAEQGAYRDLDLLVTYCRELEEENKRLEGQQQHYFRGHQEDRARISRLAEALGNLVGAARGMPVSHDNLCQSTLMHAIEEAEKEL